MTYSFSRRPPSLRIAPQNPHATKQQQPIPFLKPFDYELSAMQTIRPILAITLFCFSGASCFAQKQPQVEIASVSLSRQDPDSEFGQPLGTFGAAGTAVDIYVKLADQTILSIDNKQSALVLSSDDGSELPLREQYDDVYGLRINPEDKSRASIQLGSKNLPGKKATRLSLSGALVLVVGKDLTTDTVDLKIAKNSKVKLGLIDATVMVRRDRDGDLNGQTIELNASRPFDSIASIEFLDGSGKVIESYPQGTGSWGGINGETTHSFNYHAESIAKSFKVRVLHFGKTNNVKLTIDKQFGLGL